MAGIQGLGGVPEPTPERPASIRDRVRRDDASQASGVKDGVRISSEAQQAADIGRLLRLSEEQAEIRADRVAEAKEGLERGDYKDMNVLREVARNLLKYIE